MSEFIVLYTINLVGSRRKAKSLRSKTEDVPPLLTKMNNTLLVSVCNEIYTCIRYKLIHVNAVINKKCLTCI